MYLVSPLIAVIGVVVVVALYISMLRMEKSAWADMARLVGLHFEFRKSLSEWPGVLRGNHRGYDVILESETRLFEIPIYQISVASVETHSRITDYLFLCRRNVKFAGTQRFWRDQQTLEQQRIAVNDAELNRQFFVAGKPQQFVVDILASNDTRQRIQRLSGKWILVCESGKIYLVWNTIITDPRKVLDGFDLIIDLADAIKSHAAERAPA